MEVIEKLAPIKEIRIKGASKPWFDGEVVERITVCDKLKIKFSKSTMKCFLKILINHLLINYQQHQINLIMKQLNYIMII